LSFCEPLFQRTLFQSFVRVTHPKGRLTPLAKRKTEDFARSKVLQVKA